MRAAYVASQRSLHAHIPRAMVNGLRRASEQKQSPSQLVVDGINNN